MYKVYGFFPFYLLINYLIIILILIITTVYYHSIIFQITDEVGLVLGNYKHNQRLFELSMLSKGIVVAGLVLFAFGSIVKFSQEMSRRQLERYVKLQCYSCLHRLRGIFLRFLSYVHINALIIVILIIVIFVLLNIKYYQYNLPDISLHITYYIIERIVFAALVFLYLLSQKGRVEWANR